MQLATSSFVYLYRAHFLWLQMFFPSWRTVFFGQSLLFTRSIHLLKMSDSRLIQAAQIMNSPKGCSAFPSVLCRQHPFQGLISYWSFEPSVKLNWHFLSLKITGIIHLLNKCPSKSLNGLWSCTADVIRQTSLFWLGHLNTVYLK